MTWLFYYLPSLLQSIPHTTAGWVSKWVIRLWSPSSKGVDILNPTNYTTGVLGALATASELIAFKFRAPWLPYKDGTVLWGLMKCYKDSVVPVLPVLVGIWRLSLIPKKKQPGNFCKFKLLFLLQKIGRTTQIHHMATANQFALCVEVSIPFQLHT